MIVSAVVAVVVVVVVGDRAPIITHRKLAAAGMKGYLAPLELCSSVVRYARHIRLNSTQQMKPAHRLWREVQLQLHAAPAGPSTWLDWKSPDKLAGEGLGTHDGRTGSASARTTANAMLPNEGARGPGGEQRSFRQAFWVGPGRRP